MSKKSSTNELTRRQQLRLAKSFPVGMFVALLTAAIVTLVGVALGLDSSVILLRASLSGVLMGTLVSVGLGIVRMADTEYKNRQPAVTERR